MTELQDINSVTVFLRIVGLYLTSLTFFLELQNVDSEVRSARKVRIVKYKLAIVREKNCEIKVAITFFYIFLFHGKNGHPYRIRERKNKVCMLIFLHVLLRQNTVCCCEVMAIIYILLDCKCFSFAKEPHFVLVH